MEENSRNKNSPSLEDYRAFHGMLCRPTVAHRCVQSFQGGVALFATQEECDAANEGNGNLACCDFNNIPFPFNTWTYYLLVVMSLTGFSSAFGFTKEIAAIEYTRSESDKDNCGETLFTFAKGDHEYVESSQSASAVTLQLPPEAMEYVIDRSLALGPVSKKRLTNDGTQLGTDGKSAAAKGVTVPEINLIRRFEYDFGGYLHVMMLHFLCTNRRIHLVEVVRFDRRTTLGFMATILMKPLYSLRTVLLKLWPVPQTVDDTMEKLNQGVKSTMIAQKSKDL